MSRGDHGQPEIGTAWLVLSHGVFLGAQIAASSLGSSFLRKDINQTLLKPVGIFWLVVSLVIGGWTFYAIDSTLKAARRIPEKTLIFGVPGFVFLFIVNGFVMAGTVWTLIVISIGGLD
jgi:hypothetical protein